MTGSMLFGAFMAALLYVLIPGPAFLALLGIGAGQGRKAGALFMGGHVAGDLLWSALRAKPRQDGAAVMTVERPLRRGLIFGLTNPKGYPVALATFTALLAGSSNALDFDALPALLGVSFFGFLLADIILIAIIGASMVRKFYRRHELAIVRMSGLLFMGFAVQAIWHAAPGLLGWRKP